MKNEYPIVRWKTTGNYSMAGSRLRAHYPIKILRERKWNASIAHKQEPFDIIVFQDSYTEEDIKLAERLKKEGKIVALDLCDNHFYYEKETRYLYNRLQRLNRMIEICHEIITSSTELAKCIDHPSVTVIDDAVEPLDSLKTFNVINPIRQFLRRTSRSTVNSLSLVWFGNSGYTTPPFGMIELAYALPVLNNVSRTIPIQLSVISDSKKLFKKYLAYAKFPTHFIKWNVRSYQYFIRQNDICIIPKHNNPFNNCKTANRVILSLQLGVPVIADLIPSYQEFLPFIQAGNWRENLLSFEKGNTVIRQKIEAAQKYIEEKYGDLNVVEQWSAFFLKALENKQRA